MVSKLDMDFPTSTPPQPPTSITTTPTTTQIPNSIPYPWPHDGSISNRTTALIVVDMQNDFCSPKGYLAHQGYPITSMRAPIPAIQHLLSHFRQHSLPIFFTREGHRPDLSTLSPRELYRSRRNSTGLGIGDVGPLGRLLVRGEPGHDIVPELYPRDGEPVVDKPGRSAFAYTDLELLLRLRGVSKLVIAGVTTDVCVSSTMREANDRGFECLIVRDACGASVDRLHDAAVETVGTEGGIFGASAGWREVVQAVGGGEGGGVVGVCGRAAAASAGAGACYSRCAVGGGGRRSAEEGVWRVLDRVRFLLVMVVLAGLGFGVVQLSAYEGRVGWVGV